MAAPPDDTAAGWAAVAWAWGAATGGVAVAADVPEAVTAFTSDPSPGRLPCRRAEIVERRSFILLLGRRSLGGSSLESYVCAGHVASERADAPEMARTAR